MPTPHLTQRPEWKALQAHYQQVKGLHLRQLFSSDALTATCAGSIGNRSVPGAAR
jgi:hypothetical protein